MRDWEYYEESELSSISYDSYRELEKEKERIEEEKYNYEEDARWFSNFIKKFIEEGNKKGQALSEAYAKMFEFYKSEGYEEYINENYR